MTLLATNQFPGDGSTDTYDFSFVDGYLDPAHVKCFIEDDLTGVRRDVSLAFLTDFRVQLQSDVAAVGETVNIYRDTAAPKMVNFQGGDRLTEKVMDLAVVQPLMLAAEAKDKQVLPGPLLANIRQSESNAAAYASNAYAAQLAAESAVTGIGNSTVTLADQAASDTLLATSPRTIKQLLQSLRNNAKDLYAKLSDKADIVFLGTAAEKDVPTSGNASSGQVVMGNDTRLSNARTPTSHAHTANDISNATTVGKALMTAANAAAARSAAGAAPETISLSDDTAADTLPATGNSTAAALLQTVRNALKSLVATTVRITREINGKPLSSDVTLTAADVGARASTWKPKASDIDTDSGTPDSTTFLRGDNQWVAPPGGAGGGGSVTSVALSAPTGFSISGSPVTTAGTLALSFAAGYSLPTTTKQNNWDTAYGWGNHASAGYLTSHQSLAGLVPTSRTVNSKPLSSDVTLSAADVSAAPASITLSNAAGSTTLPTTESQTQATKIQSLRNNARWLIEYAERNSGGILSFTNNEALTADASGKYILPALGTAKTVRLPAASGIVDGAFIGVFNTLGEGLTINVASASGNTFMGLRYASGGSLTIPSRTSVRLVKSGTNWVVVDGGNLSPCEGTAPIYGIRGWCNFSIEGGTWIGVHKSANVAGVSHDSTGQYTITLDQPMVDAGGVVSVVSLYTRSSAYFTDDTHIQVDTIDLETGNPTDGVGGEEWIQVMWTR